MRPALGLLAFGAACVMGGLGLVFRGAMPFLEPSGGFCLVIDIGYPVLTLMLWTAGLVALSYGVFWLVGMRFTEPLETTPRARVSRSALVPPRRGATLISVLASMAIIAICLTLVLQAYMHGGRFVELQQRRSDAAMACQARIERARAQGYAALPAVGEHAFDAGEGLDGTLVIEVGPQENSRTVTARVRWEKDSAAPGGDVELVTIMTP
jgi:type II secretory pathway pseudopilin PulG